MMLKAVASDQGQEHLATARRSYGTHRYRLHGGNTEMAGGGMFLISNMSEYLNCATQKLFKPR